MFTSAGGRGGAVLQRHQQGGRGGAAGGVRVSGQVRASTRRTDRGEGRPGFAGLLSLQAVEDVLPPVDEVLVGRGDGAVSATPVPPPVFVLTVGPTQTGPWLLGTQTNVFRAANVWVLLDLQQ